MCFYIVPSLVLSSWHLCRITGLFRLPETESSPWCWNTLISMGWICPATVYWTEQYFYGTYMEYHILCLAKLYRSVSRVFLIFAAVFYLKFFIVCLFCFLFIHLFSLVLATCIMQKLLWLFLGLNMSQTVVTWSGFVIACVMLVKEAMHGFCVPLEWSLAHKQQKRMLPLNLPVLLTDPFQSF